MLCRGSWAEESFYFIVLSDVAGPPRYVMVNRTDLDSTCIQTYVYFTYTPKSIYAVTHTRARTHTHAEGETLKQIR